MADTQTTQTTQTDNNTDEAKKKSLLDFIGETLDGKTDDAPKNDTTKKDDVNDGGGDGSADDGKKKGVSATPSKPEDGNKGGGDGDENPANADGNKKPAVQTTEPTENKKKEETTPNNDDDTHSVGDEELSKLFEDIDFADIEANDGMSLDSLKGLVNGVKRLRDVLIGVIKDYGEFIENARNEKAEGEFDEIFEGLSDEFGDVLGRGKIRALDAAMQKNRNDVLNKAAVLMKAYRDSGEQKALKDVVKEAALLMFNEQMTKKPSQTVVKQERRGAFIAKPNTPSGSGGTAEEHEARALALINQALK